MTPLHRDRLLLLADHLDTLRPEDFQMEEWLVEVPGCGTVGCACGHACSLPRFQQEGLSLRNVDGCYTEVRSFELVYEHHRGFAAAQAFLGLDWEQAGYLFSGLEYPQLNIMPGDVSQRIRALVQEGAA